MTMREWIERSAGTVAPRAELDAFETGMLFAADDMQRHGFQPTAIHADCEPEMWRLAFDFWRGMFPVSR